MPLRAASLPLPHASHPAPMSLDLRQRHAVFVVGAGIMGAGIAQVAAQAGHRCGCSTRAKARPRRRAPSWPRRSTASPPKAGSSGRRSARRSPRASSRRRARRRRRLRPRRRGDRRERRRQAQPLSRPRGASSATPACSPRTRRRSRSPRSPTACKQPGRVVGMHFFNPVPLMKLVEVVSGLQTEPAVAAAIFDLAGRWGKTPVHARSTPGLHRQPHRPAVLRRGARAAARARRRAGDDRRLPARRRLSHGPVRADGPDRPRHQLRGHAVGVRRQLRRQALHAVAGPARAGRRRPARPQVGPRLLQLRRRRAPVRRRPRPQRPRCPPGAAGAIVALHGRGVAVERWAARLERGRHSLRGRPGEPLERPADRCRRAAPDRRPRRDAASPPKTACASSRSSTSPSRRAAARPARRSRSPSRRALRRRGASRPRTGCASPAGSRSRSAMRRA